MDAEILGSVGEGDLSVRARNTRSHSGAPTIADVARVAGCSPMTVSRVINGEKSVRASTREKVEAAVTQLNYAPNLAARSLAGGDEIRLGLIYANPSAGYLSRMLVGSLEQARTNGLQLVIEDYSSESDPIGRMRAMLLRGIDGLVLCPPLSDRDDVVSFIADEDVPAVVLANWHPPKSIWAVTIDDVEASRSMVRHLLSLGHRRIGFVTGDKTHQASGQRLKGFYAAMADGGVAVDPGLIAAGEFTFRSGLAAAEALLMRPDPPTAIFASNDDMAAAVVAVAHRLHFDIPSDLTVCGYDDTDFARSIWPELTTIHQPIADMARAAVDLLTRRIRALRGGSVVEATQDELAFTLVTRASSGPPQPQ